MNNVPGARDFCNWCKSKAASCVDGFFNRLLHMLSARTVDIARSSSALCDSPSAALQRDSACGPAATGAFCLRIVSKLREATNRALVACAKSLSDLYLLETLALCSSHCSLFR